jgi:hypothetical protein
MGCEIVPEIIAAVADAKGVEPKEVDLSLYEHIDPDAIRLLTAHSTASWTLSFELPEHTVTVTSDGLILVDGAPEQLWA